MSIHMSKIAVIGFDGNPKEWDQWLIKTTAIADAGGWGVAMESDLTGGTPEEKKKNNKGWQYLALALTGTPFTIATRKANRNNVFKTISALKAKYEATEVGEYIELTKDFTAATMKSNKEDPEIYIDRLEKISDQMEAIDEDYKKSEIEIVAQAFANLPKLYENLMDSFSIQGKEDDLQYVRDELHKKWRKKYGYDSGLDKTGGTEEQVLNTETGKICSNCGKKGHLVDTCWGKGGGKEGQGPKQGKGKGGGGKFVPITERKCYNCNKTGHIAKNCPEKNKDKKEEHQTFGVFCLEVVEEDGSVDSDMPELVRRVEGQYDSSDSESEDEYDDMPELVNPGDEGYDSSDSEDEDEEEDEIPDLIDAGVARYDSSDSEDEEPWIPVVRRKRHPNLFGCKQVKTCGGCGGHGVLHLPHRCFDKGDELARVKPMVLIEAVEECFLTKEEDEVVEDWLVDTGSTTPLGKSDRLGYNVRNTKATIRVGTNDTMETTKEFDCAFQDVTRGDNGPYFGISSIKHGPKFTKNIMAVKPFLKKGCTMLMDGEWLTVQSEDGKTIVSAKRNDDGLYYARLKRIQQQHYVDAIEDGQTDPNSDAPKEKPHVIEPDAVNERGDGDEKQSKKASEVDGGKEKKDEVEGKITLDDAHDTWGHKTELLLRLTAKHYNYKVLGKLTACEACAYAKSKQKRVQKNTNKRADEPGERLFVDTAGPYHETPGGTRYLTQVLDDYSSFGWSSFHHHKSKLVDRLDQAVVECEGLGYKVKFIRADNAGENEKPLEDYCKKKGIILELTASNTPQLNGRVERRIAVNIQRANAQMYAAQFEQESREKYWAESVRAANFLENVTMNSVRPLPPFEMFYKRKVPTMKLLQPFGRIGVVANRAKIQAKFGAKGTKMIHLGQASNRPADTYRFLNIATKKTCNSRDVTWLDFSRPNPRRNVSIFVQDPAMMSQGAGIDDNEVPDNVQDTEVQTPRVGARGTTTANKISDDESEDVAEKVTPTRRAFIQQVRQHLPQQQQRMSTRSRPNPVNATVTFEQRDQAARVNREMRKLDGFFSAASQAGQDQPKEDSMATQPIESEDPNEKDSTEQVHFMFDEWIMKTSARDERDYEVPSNVREALQEPWAKNWVPSVKSEIENFMNRGSWKFVSKLVPKELGRKVMKTMTVFKVKDEVDGSIRHKTRICSKGYMQIPGVDYTESFSPVVNDASQRLVFALYLTKENEWIIECIDVEAAFLEGSVQRRCFITIPIEVLLLGYVTQEEYDGQCIELMKGMYGNVDAALMFFQEYKGYLMKAMKMKQSRADPCIFYKDNEEGETILIAMVYVDDTILVGEKGEVSWFKSTLGERFKYTSQGGIKKHLGINYELKRDENGNPVWELTSPKLVHQIIKKFVDTKGHGLKESTLPATPGHTTIKYDGDPEAESDYRSIVGKIMYLVTKLMPEGGNPARELSRQFGNPSQEHWKELEKFVGFLSREKEKIKLTIRKPKALRMIGMFDTNFATNPDDRKSVGGKIVTLGGAIMDWGSKTMPTVATSTSQAEYQQLSNGCGDIRHGQQLLEELAEDEKPGIACEDNSAAMFLMKNQQVSQRTKHIDVKYHYIRELREQGFIEPVYVKSEDNNADIETKNLPKALYVKHSEALRSGKSYVYDNFEEIVETARKGLPNSALREDVVNRMDETQSCESNIHWQESVPSHELKTYRYHAVQPEDAMGDFNI